MTGSEWDHVGVVVPGHSPTSFHLLEATGEGVSAFPLVSVATAFVLGWLALRLNTLQLCDCAISLLLLLADLTPRCVLCLPRQVYRSAQAAHATHYTVGALRLAASIRVRGKRDLVRSSSPDDALRLTTSLAGCGGMVWNVRSKATHTVSVWRSCYEPPHRTICARETSSARSLYVQRSVHCSR